MPENEDAINPIEINQRGLKTEHLASELNFYRQAYQDPDHRREKGFAWEKTPSKTVIDIVEKNHLADNPSSQRVLDLGAGEGRHLEYFKSLGFDVTGVDFCQEAVDLCKGKFGDDPKVHLVQADLAAPGALSDLGEYDIVLDWSVLDHMRPEYRETYLNNIIGSLRSGGHIVLAEFDPSMPGLEAGKDSKVVNGHYSKAYTVEEMVKILNGLRLVDSREGVLEDEINDLRFNTVLMRKD